MVFTCYFLLALCSNVVFTCYSFCLRISRLDPALGAKLIINKVEQLAGTWVRTTPWVRRMLTGFGGKLAKWGVLTKQMNSMMSAGFEYVS